MTLDDLRRAVANGRCSWDDILDALSSIGLITDEQLAFLDGSTPIPTFAVMRLRELI